MKALRMHLTSLAVAAAFVIGAPAFANHPAASPILGAPVHDGGGSLKLSPDRTVAIDAGTRWVNVTGGETIRFVVDGQSFYWAFNTFTHAPAFALGAIAPRGTPHASVKIFVSPDPAFTG
jgi:hypothetical protein